MHFGSGKEGQGTETLNPPPYPKQILLSKKDEVI